MPHRHRPAEQLILTMLFTCILWASGCSPHIQPPAPGITADIPPGNTPPSVAMSAATTQPPTQHYPLNNQAYQMAQTEEGRQFIQYLVDCALPKGFAAYADVNGKHYEFPGSIGLVPPWVHRPLTEDEQRWLSACILARTNYFGIKVEISMRNTHSPFAALQTTEQERKEFTLDEGDFFGNLFADSSVAGVALGRRTPQQQNDPVFKLRVCTEVDPSLPPINGKKLSRCRFIITGYVDEPDAHTLNGQKFDQYISVYLKP